MFRSRSRGTRLTGVLVAVASCASVVVATSSGVATATTTTRPTCVVSLSPTATETLFAIGAGPQVQAVDQDSNFPTHGLPSKRINALNPSVESVLGICRHGTGNAGKPDLVVISYDANKIAEKLEGVGVRVLTQDAPVNLAGALSQIRHLGTLTGHAARADALASSLARSIAADVRSVPAHPAKKLHVYYELDPTLYSLTSSTFVGSFLRELGVINIADGDSTSADYGYPKLSAEYVASADPQLILLADTICCHVTRASLAARAGFSQISAVRFGHVVGLDDDIASRWGPRLSILLADLARAVRSTLADPRVWKK